MRITGTEMNEKYGREFAICFPTEEHEHKFEWYLMPSTVFDHKEYPTCKCGRKFVQLKENDTECFFCQFTKK